MKLGIAAGEISMIKYLNALPGRSTDYLVKSKLELTVHFWTDMSLGEGINNKNECLNTKPRIKICL